MNVFETLKSIVPQNQDTTEIRLRLKSRLFLIAAALSKPATENFRFVFLVQNGEFNKSAVMPRVLSNLRQAAQRLRKSQASAAFGRRKRIEI